MCRAGYYKNPGVKQSRSARYGPGIRTEEQALSIVLSWMSKQHELAIERAQPLDCAYFCFLFVSLFTLHIIRVNSIGHCCAL